MRGLAVAGLAAIACASLSAAARGQIDPSGKWRTWHTRHFRVHAKSHLSADAAVAANEAERAYALLAGELKPPRGTIDLVLSDDVDFSNGFTTSFPTNRIVVYLAPPSSAISSGVYDIWLRMLVTHELVHVFHVDRAAGIWGVLQSLFGRAPGLFPNAYQPAWVTEGLATYYESRFTNAGRIRGAYHDQLLSAAESDNRWPAPGDVMKVNSAWPSGTAPYAWGGRFFASQASEFGDSSIAKFVERSARQLIVFNVNGPLKRAGSAGVAHTWSRLRESARVPSETTGVIVRGLRREPRLRLAREGRLLAYRHVDGRNVERLVVRDLAQGRRVVSHKVNSVNELEWVGGDIYFTQLEFDSPVRIRGDLYRWSLSTAVDRLSRDSRTSDVWVVPGTGIGVTRLVAGKRHLFLFAGEDATGEPEPFPAPPADDWGRVAASPDGGWIAAARHANGQWDIVAWPSGRPEQYEMISEDPAMDQDPAWSTDGDMILFASERAGLPQVFAYDRRAAVSYQLTHVPTGAREPALAPDGTLYYATLLGDGYAVGEEHHWERQPRVTEPSSTVPPAFAPDAGARETGYAPWGTLKPHYWIPLGHDERDAGTFVGGFTSAYDAVGRSSYELAGTVAPSTGRWEAVATLTHRRWPAWSFDVTAGQTWEYGGMGLSQSGGRVPVSFRERSAEIGLRYAWRRWRTGFGTRLATFVERDDLTNDGSEPLGWVPDSATLGGAALALNLWRLERAPWSIAPENGVTVSGLYVRRWDLGGSGHSTELRGGINGYLALPLPGFANWVLAVRAAGAISGGRDPTVFSLGGQSGDVVSIIPGTTLGSGRRSFPLRAYTRGGRFTRAVATYVELRVPLMLVGKGVWRLPLLVDRASATVFYEMGGGWVEGEPAAPTGLRDVGGELVVDLGVGASIPLRVRGGLAVALADGPATTRGAPRAYVAFGSSF